MILNGPPELTASPALNPGDQSAGVVVLMTEGHPSSVSRRRAPRLGSPFERRGTLRSTTSTICDSLVPTSDGFLRSPAP